VFFYPERLKTDAVYDEWINSIPFIDPQQAQGEAALAEMKQAMQGKDLLGLIKAAAKAKQKP
jgi:hypothetical protein